MHLKSKKQYFFRYVNLPKKKHSLTFLRAPNRAKKSQICLNTIHFKSFILIKLILNLNVKTSTQLIVTLQKLCNNFKFFESNILNLHSLEFNIPYKFKIL